MLTRLEHHKLVISGWETPALGQRSQKYYRLTGEGIAAARRTAVVPVRPAPGSPK